MMITHGMHLAKPERAQALAEAGIHDQLPCDTHEWDYNSWHDTGHPRSRRESGVSRSALERRRSRVTLTRFSQRSVPS